MGALDQCVNRLITAGTLRNAAIRVGKNDEILIDSYFSHTDSGLCDSTLFDMASITKMIATTSIALAAMSEGRISCDDRVEKYFSVPIDKNELTLRHLLTHTMGFGHKNLCTKGVNYDNVAEHILSIPNDVKIGSKVLYSCPGYILLGKILEKVLGARLDVLLKKYVTEPLGMTDTCYLPDPKGKFAPCNFRGRYFNVNDYNCEHLGGVAGNAGVFSNICDLTKYAQMLLCGGYPIVDKEIFEMAVKNYTPKHDQSRALGFLYVDEKYDQTGKLFPKGSIGHCGHTGQSLFVHPGSGLYAIILTDATATLARSSNDNSYDYSVVCKMRQMIHNAIAEDIGRDNKNKNLKNVI
ncbi:MAG: beta-lactamase family protein [Ruminococcaceae bacterium]|nr:beta-lactamase family protein [Oscillospiraceae bacterium]